MALACLAVLRHQGVDFCGAPSWIQGSIPSLPTCVTETPGTSVLFPGIGTRAGSSGAGQQDDPEGHTRDCQPAQSGYLQPSLPCGEGDGAGGPSSICQRLCHADEIQDGDSGVCLGVYQEGGLNVLDRPQRCLLSDSHSSGLSAIPLVLSRRTWLSVPYPVIWPVHSCAGSSL